MVDAALIARICPAIESAGDDDDDPREAGCVDRRRYSSRSESTCSNDFGKDRTTRPRAAQHPTGRRLIRSPSLRPSVARHCARPITYRTTWWASLSGGGTICNRDLADDD